MFVLIGYVVACAMIFGGYAAAGGHLAGLWQPLEVVMIFGGALGAFVVAYGGKPLKGVIKALPKIFKGSPYNKAFFMDLFALHFELLSKVRKEGLMSIEGDVENPEGSPIFSKYPSVVHDHHVTDFIADYLRLMVGGNLNAFEIENLMDIEIEGHHHEAAEPSHAVSTLADGLPAFGIVAAVMGVVHTMENVGLPPAELGILIAHALVGTFLGILLAYGFVGPLAKVLEARANDSTKVYQTIKTILLASLNGYAPQVAVEFGRKAMDGVDRPSFKELEDHVKSTKGK